MSKIHKTSLTGDNAVNMEAASKYVVARLPTIPEGRLDRLAVRQQAADVTDIGFKVDILDTLPEGMAVGQSTGTLPADIDLYRVLAQQSATAGNSVYVASNEAGYAYISDGDPTVRRRYIYLVISTSSGSAAGSICNFDTVMVVESMYAT